jgi:hypothetical protein
MCDAWQAKMEAHEPIRTPNSIENRQRFIHKKFLELLASKSLQNEVGMEYPILGVLNQKNGLS